MKSLNSTYGQGFVADNICSSLHNGCINHIHTYRDRCSLLPQAVFCTNDSHIRTLDCNTNKVVLSHKLDWAVNCVATSPHNRLQLLVGDCTGPWIIRTDTGERLVTLPNHRDYGFACDWAPDGMQVATGNLDGLVQIFDVRNWKWPFQTLVSELGGVRSMRFSPHGKRVLAMAEPADYISVVDATTFRTQQRFHCLGELGGLSFTPDSSQLFVSNTDPDFGGILEFDRAKPDDMDIPDP